MKDLSTEEKGKAIEGFQKNFLLPVTGNNTSE